MPSFGEHVFFLFPSYFFYSFSFLVEHCSGKERKNIIKLMNHNWSAYGERAKNRFLEDAEVSVSSSFRND